MEYLTSMEGSQDVETLQANIHEMVLDWLAAGIDPEQTIIFVQSHVPEVMELHTLLSMVTPLSWLMRVPTFKEKAKTQPQNVNYGLVGYPVLMTADIVLYHGEVVPVGEDQLPHLELAREIVTRYHGKKAAAEAEQDFRLKFEKRSVPEKIDCFPIPPAASALVSLLHRHLKLVSSANEARRMVRQGAVKINGQKVTDEKLSVTLRPGDVIQVGKRRFAKVE